MRAHPIVLMCLFAGMAGAVSAQVTTKFRAEKRRLQETADTKGLTEGQVLANRMLNPFASPGVIVQKVRPGATVAVTLSGTFPSGTIFLSERDDAAFNGGAFNATTYSARLTIPQDEGPGFVRLWAFAPGSISGPAAVALVETLYRFDLKSPDGYVVKIAPIETTFTIEDNKRAKVKYQAEFYKPGETKPFETLTGDQAFDVAEAPYDGSRLDIEFSQSANSREAELEAINNKMGDPKTTAAERNALMVRMGEVQQKMLEEMSKALQTDPASLNKKQDDFGCGLMQLYPGKNGTAEGNIACGQNFSGGTLKVAGTMTQVR